MQRYIPMLAVIGLYALVVFNSVMQLIQWYGLLATADAWERGFIYEQMNQHYFLLFIGTTLLGFLAFRLRPKGEE